MEVTILDLLTVIKDRLAAAATQAIQQFDWTAPGVDSGACGDVAKAMKQVIEQQGIKVDYDYIESDDTSENPFHTRLIAIDPITRRKIIIDVPYFYYERLTKTNSWDEPCWELINNTIEPDMVQIEEEF